MFAESVNPGAVDVFRLNVTLTGATSVGGTLLKYTKAKVVSDETVAVLLLEIPSQPPTPFWNLNSKLVLAANA